MAAGLLRFVDDRNRRMDTRLVAVSGGTGPRPPVGGTVVGRTGEDSLVVGAGSSAGVEDILAAVGRCKAAEAHRRGLMVGTFLFYSDKEPNLKIQNQMYVDKNV